MEYLKNKDPSSFVENARTCRLLFLIYQVNFHFENSNSKAPLLIFIYLYRIFRADCSKNKVFQNRLINNGKIWKNVGIQLLLGYL